MLELMITCNKIYLYTCALDLQLTELHCSCTVCLNGLYRTENDSAIIQPSDSGSMA